MKSIWVSPTFVQDVDINDAMEKMWNFVKPAIIFPSFIDTNIKTRINTFSITVDLFDSTDNIKINNSFEFDLFLCLHREFTDKYEEVKNNPDPFPLFTVSIVCAIKDLNTNKKNYTVFADKHGKTIQQVIYKESGNVVLSMGNLFESLIEFAKYLNRDRIYLTYETIPDKADPIFAEFPLKLRFYDSQVMNDLSKIRNDLVLRSDIAIGGIKEEKNIKEPSEKKKITETLPDELIINGTRYRKVIENTNTKPLEQGIIEKYI